MLVGGIEDESKLSQITSADLAISLGLLQENKVDLSLDEMMNVDLIAHEVMVDKEMQETK